MIRKSFADTPLVVIALLLTAFGIAIVYSAALDVTRDLYPQLNDAPGPGKISTAWHQVQYGNNQDDLSNQRTIAAGQGVQPGLGQGARMAGVPTRLAYKRYFIRFDIHVMGGRPWRVKVVGHASEWDPGAAMPSELKGAQRPPWLDGRIDALYVAIYKRIKQFAVPMKEEVVEPSPEDAIPKTELRKDLRDVRLDRRLAHEQLGTDLGVR